MPGTGGFTSAQASGKRGCTDRMVEAILWRQPTWLSLSLIVTGCSTSGCVRGTVVDGFAYNFRTIVPQDAVFDRSQVSHAVNLFDMAEKYADVMPTDDVIAQLKALTPAP